jgi:NitT/TauT family transport system substrate-binding protein
VQRSESRRGRSIRRLSPLLVAAVTGLAVAGCASSSGGSSGASLASLTTNVNPGSDSYMPVYVAEYGGFFKKNGLNVTVVPVDSSATAAEFALGGKLNIVYGSPVPVIAAEAHDQPLKIVAQPTPGLLPALTLMGSPKESWPAGSASAEVKLRSLIGKTVGVNGIGGGVYNMLLSYLAKAGVKSSQVRIVNVAGYAAAIPLLAAQRIDAYYEFTGLGKALEEQAGDVAVWSTTAQPVPGIPGETASLVFSTESWLTDHPKQAEEYLTALQQAIQYIMSNPSGAAKIFAQYGLDNKYSVKTVMAVQKIYTAYYNAALRTPSFGAAPSFNLAQALIQLQGDPSGGLPVTQASAQKIVWQLPGKYLPKTAS